MAELAADIQGLPMREQTVLTRRYGLDGTKPATFREIGEELNLTRERARQIHTHALNRLSGLRKQRFEREITTRWQRLLGRLEEPKLTPELAARIDKTPIEELTLGNRSYNCLKRVGVETISELAHLTDDELLAIPNFGTTALAEVRYAINEITGGSPR